MPVEDLETPVESVCHPHLESQVEMSTCRRGFEIVLGSTPKHPYRTRHVRYGSIPTPCKLVVRIRRDGRSSGSQVSEVLTCDHRRGGPIALLSRSSPSRRSPHLRHGRIATISLGRGGCLDRLALRCTSSGCWSAAGSSISNGATCSAKRAERCSCVCDVCRRAGAGCCGGAARWCVCAGSGGSSS